MALVTRWKGMALSGAVGMLLGCPSVGCSADDGPKTVADGAGGNTTPKGDGAGEHSWYAGSLAAWILRAGTVRQPRTSWR